MKKVIKLIAPVNMNETILLVESSNGVESGWYVKYRDEVREVSEVKPFTAPLVGILFHVILKEGFPFILESETELEAFSTKLEAFSTKKALYVKNQGSLRNVKEVYVKFQGSLHRVKAIYKKEGGELKGREV